MGVPLPMATNRSRKRAGRNANLPAPTLASTRSRRQGELAFFNKADGFHVKRVIRRPTTQAAVPQIPYLPGQEGESALIH